MRRMVRGRATFGGLRRAQSTINTESPYVCTANPPCLVLFSFNYALLDYSAGVLCAAGIPPHPILTVPNSVVVIIPVL
jgi:hypothetical protein